VEIRILRGVEIKALLPMGACIELMRRTMIGVSQGRAHIPARSVMPTSQGMMGLMPGALEDPDCFGLKLLSLFPGNPAVGLSSHLGLVLLFEPEHGRPVAMMDAAEITAIRTAAASGLATDLLAPPDAGDLAILGAGEQAASHLEAMLAVRPVRRVRVWSRTAAHAETFAASQSAKWGVPVEAVADPRAAVTGADLVCTVSAARAPILEGAWIAPGAHLNVAGASRPDAVEIDTDAVTRSRYFVDYRPSTHLEAAEYLRALADGAITEAHILAEIGEVASGAQPGRLTASDITLYRSLGIAAQDLASAHYLLDAARAADVGQTVEF
jgi:ornithine cyclodeaminase/alanine dehydrogenase-like protein (mu-crystallin family)